MGHGPAQQRGQRRQGTRGYDLCGRGGGVLNARRVYRDRGGCCPGRLAKERRLALIGFDEMEMAAGCYGEDKARETAA